MSVGSKTRTRDPERERAIQATAWFSVLIHARRTNDFREAATAQAELEQIGVAVKFRRTAGQAAAEGNES